MKRSIRSLGLLALFGLFAFCLAGHASAITLEQLQNDITYVVNTSHPDVQWSIKIENEAGSGDFYSKNPTTMRRPASNTKIFTTAAAFLKYGVSHVWRGYALGSTSTSSPIHDILTWSDNYLADDLFSYVGGQSACLTQIAKITSTSGMVMYDGSGLNYNNRFNCEQTLDVVRYMKNYYTHGQWSSHLANSCVSGTLGSRLCGTGKTGRVWAKTGTLTNGGTLSLSGYVDNLYDGKRYYFSIYCNNVPSAYQSDTRNRIDTIVGYMCQSGLPTLSTNPTITVDNLDPGYSEAGAWSASANAGYYYQDSRWAGVYNQSQNNTATWVPGLTAAGTYKVYAWWVAGSNRSPGAAYYVHHTGGSALVRVNQQANGGKWNLLGEFAFMNGSASKVVLESDTSYNGGNPNAVISADAVRFEYIAPMEYIVDNTDSGFAASSNWFASTSVPGYYGSNYHARATASVSDAAQWTATLPYDGQYTVATRWTEGSNRASSAPYVVTTANGDVTVTANQRINGGKWMNLGQWYLWQGTAVRAKLSCWTSSGDYVIADAVRWTHAD